MNLNNENLLQLQDEYLRTGSQEKLTEIYNLVTKLAEKIIKKLSNKYQYQIQDNDIEILAHDTATTIVEKYLMDNLCIKTSYIGYVYRVVHYLMFREKQTVDIADYEDTIDSNISIEDTILNEIHEEQLADTIISIAMQYLQEHEQEKQIQMLDYLQDVIGRGKDINTYLYKITAKKDKDLFRDIVAEIRVYLESEYNAEKTSA